MIGFALYIRLDPELGTNPAALAIAKTMAEQAATTHGLILDAAGPEVEEHEGKLLLVWAAVSARG